MRHGPVAVVIMPEMEAHKMSRTWFLTRELEYEYGIPQRVSQEWAWALATKHPPLAKRAYGTFPGGRWEIHVDAVPFLRERIANARRRQLTREKAVQAGA